MSEIPTGKWHTAIGWLDGDAWDDEPHQYADHASFASAREWMMLKLIPFVDDDCTDCQRTGTRVLIDLVLQPPSSHLWIGEVDGHSYVIGYTPPGRDQTNWPTVGSWFRAKRLQSPNTTVPT